VSLLNDVLLFVLLNIGLIAGVLAGLFALPLVAMLGPPALVGGPLSGITMRISQLACPDGTVLHRQPDGSYEAVSPEAFEDIDRTQMVRWKGAPFGVAYARDEQMWGDAADRVEAEAADGGAPVPTAGGEGPPGEHRVPTDVQRDNVPGFLDRRELRGADFLINWAAALREHTAEAGMRMAERAQRHAREDFGGDTSEFSGWVHYLAVVTMFLGGAGVGLVMYL
jgi:hypothetical protein